MKYVGMVLAGIAMTALVLEIGLRIGVLFPHDSGTFINDADIGIRVRPHTPFASYVKKTNSRGFHDIEHQPEKPEGIKRVAVIGDSFVFGAVPIEHNFVRLMQQKADADRRPIEMLNLGIPAAEPTNYLRLIQHDADQMNADVVCVMITMGSDIYQAHPDFKTIVWLGSTREVLERPYLIGPSREYSYVYRGGRSLSRILGNKLTRDKPGSFSKATYLSIARQRLPFFKQELSVYARQCYEELYRVIKQMKQAAQERGMTFVLILTPDEIQVDKQLLTEIYKKYQLDPEAYDLAKPNLYLRNKLHEEKVLILDLLDAFEQAAASKALYLLYDGHLNEAGSVLAAKHIWHFLMREGLI